MLKLFARKRCFDVVSNYYPVLSLKSDTFGMGWFYRSFFEIPDKKMLECLCDNIFNKHSEISMYEWGIINPLE